MGERSSHLRLAELVGALSLGIDLGFGQPMEHTLRQCLIALRLADQIGLDQDARVAVYYTSLLIAVGCHSDAHEQAKWFGDDIALKADKYDYELRSVRATAAGIRRLGAGRAPLHRFKLALEFAVSGHREVDRMIEHHAAIASTLAEYLELPDAVIEALGAAYEAWDGKGWPGRLQGEAIPIAVRLASIAEFVEVAYRVGGADAARRLVRDRRGKQFDPRLADLVSAEAELLLSDLDALAAWDEVIAAEPGLLRVLGGEHFDAALQAIANFVDLKTPHFLGHARGVAALAAEAGAQSGLSADDVTTLRRAGLAHGFGRLGISNAIWDKPGPLGPGEWERVRLQPYLTDRMLRQAVALRPVAAVVVQLRERLDGSGYPSGTAGTGIARPARILAAADAYQAMREPRPHRPARTAGEAAAELRAEVKAGRLDQQAVDAVLGAAGHQVLRRREGPAGLTAREVEVLRLLARGLSNKQIAAQLVISPKTVANHAEHIYAKIDVPTRTAAGLFAMRHGLLPEEEFPARVPV